LSLLLASYIICKSSVFFIIVKLYEMMFIQIKYETNYTLSTIF